MTTLMLLWCLTDEFVCECRLFLTGAFQSDIYVWTCVCFSTKTPFSTQPEMPMSEKFDLVMEYFGKMAGKMMRRLGMMRTMIIDIDWGKQYQYYKIAKGKCNNWIDNLNMAYYRQWRYVNICFIKENMWLGFRERRHWVQQLCLPLWKGHRRPVGLLIVKLRMFLKKRTRNSQLQMSPRFLPTRGYLGHWCILQVDPPPHTLDAFYWCLCIETIVREATKKIG